ncbi:hypothetical protein TNCT_465121 [Trichonephila clavata]|uniref:Uncharacterized protein n=1 Tax=Trichonephila clavata TaxID=2740835 RepID=A0A8X6L429_TRICU|nr:hypothetical protein TNCT_465121 [Trichonephila clavata]
MFLIRVENDGQANMSQMSCEFLAMFSLILSTEFEANSSLKQFYSSMMKSKRMPSEPFQICLMGCNGNKQSVQSPPGHLNIESMQSYVY